MIANNNNNLYGCFDISYGVLSTDAIFTVIIIAV